MTADPFNSINDATTLHRLERGTAPLPDMAGNAVRHRVAALLRRQARVEPASSLTRGVLAIATGVAAMLWPEISLGAMLVVFGAYAIADATLAIATAVAGRTHRWRLLAQAAVDIGVVVAAIVHPDLTRRAALTVLAVWVVVMGALRLRDAFDFDGGVHVNGLLAVLALLAITAGAGAILAPDDSARVVIINVWIFTILRGVTLIASRHQAAPAA
jgi:uncharacterized membrane protein HdeD (DUF308 family)